MSNTDARPIAIREPATCTDAARIVPPRRSEPFTSTRAFGAASTPLHSIELADRSTAAREHPVAPDSTVAAPVRPGRAAAGR